MLQNATFLSRVMGGWVEAPCDDQNGGPDGGSPESKASPFSLIWPHGRAKMSSFHYNQKEKARQRDLICKPPSQLHNVPQISSVVYVKVEAGNS